MLKKRKGLLKLTGIIAGIMLIGVFALAFTACDNGSTNGDGGGGGTNTIPGVPANVTAFGIASNAVVISWNAVPGATQYTVYGSLNQSGPFNNIGSVTETAALHSQITSNGSPAPAGTTIWYKVSAKNSAGEGSQSAAVSGTTTTSAPASHSLNGNWQIDTNGYTVSISGSTGTYTSFGSTNALTQSAIDKGYFKIGNQAFKSLNKTGDLTWSGEVFLITYNNSSPNIATGTNWANCTITMRADGKTFSIYSASADSGSRIFTRR